MKYIFFGNNALKADWLKELVRNDISVCTNYLQINNLLSPAKRQKKALTDYCVFFEKINEEKDLPTIGQLHAAYPELFIVLLGEALKKEEKLPYLKAGIDCMITPNSRREEIDKILTFAATLKTKTQQGQGTPACDLAIFKLPPWKRAFDILASSGAILLLSPLLLATALAIRMESKGPVVYKSKRVGSNYKIFDFYKFRSMYADADRRLAEYKKHNQYQADPEETVSGNPVENPEAAEAASGDIVLFSDNQSTSETDYLMTKRTERTNAFFKLENDPRITRIGHFIRKYSIDELPQLFNILKGDMSVVGNRPLPLYEAELLTSDEYIQRFMAPAGLTGLWQVEKRGSAGKMSAEERKQLDIKYAHNFSFALDLKIIIRTFTAFIQKEDV